MWSSATMPFTSLRIPAITPSSFRCRSISASAPAAGCSGHGGGSSTVTNDDVYIGNVPVTIDCDGTTCVPGGTPGGTGSGAHYGIGLEQWGVGATANNSLFQGGNGPDTCAAGYGCSGWNIDGRTSDYQRQRHQQLFLRLSTSTSLEPLAMRTAHPHRMPEWS